MKKPRKQELRKDTTDRRLRHIPQPKGLEILLTETDVLRFEFIQRHGDLPLTLIHEYTKQRCKNLDATRKRFTKLFHEKKTLHKGTYIDRDPSQYETRNSDYQFGVYQTNKRSNKVLEERGLYQANTPHTSSSWRHDFLRACYSASIELACLKEPDKYEYIPHHRIIDKIGTSKFDVDGDTFRPDLIHGIRYLDSGKVTMFMVEIDMNTEQLRSTQKNKDKTFEEKLKIYKKYFEDKLFKKDFGSRTGIMMHTVTTNKVHMDNLIELAKDVVGGGCNFMLFNYVDGFEFGFIPPSKPFPLFKAPSLRPGRADFYMSDPNSK